MLTDIYKNPYTPKKEEKQADQNTYKYEKNFPVKPARHLECMCCSRAVSSLSKGVHCSTRRENPEAWQPPPTHNTFVPCQRTHSFTTHRHPLLDPCSFQESSEILVLHSGGSGPSTYEENKGSCAYTECFPSWPKATVCLIYTPPLSHNDHPGQLTTFKTISSFAHRQQSSWTFGS